MSQGNYVGKIFISGLDSQNDFTVTSKNLSIQGERESSVTPLVAMVPQS